MSTPTLGRLERVELRAAWATEAGDFTLWLARAENLKLLGEVLEMELELEAQEQSVGPFRADILCRDVVEGSWVLIENQLERTDHTHLGQLLTYAAGLDAVTIVWIAERFTDEHRAALDWLNDKTPEGIGFFGLEVELWRIGESAIAPKFNVACRPNEWTRTVVRRSGPDSETREEFREYWTGVLSILAPSGILKGETKPFRKQHMPFRVGWHKFRLKAYFSRANKDVGVWVTSTGGDAIASFQALREHREQIEAAFGEPLDWREDLAQNSGWAIKVYRGYDPNNRDDWPRQHAFLAEKIASLYRATAPVVARLEQTGNGEPVA